jgi:predicted NBD/HSP70 family sugar kinase
MQRGSRNSQDLKLFNRLLVRNVIREKAPVARFEIARETGLTPSAVTVIVNDLIGEGAVSEMRLGRSTGGRRPVMLGINPKAAFVFGVRLQKNQIEMAIFDLGGTILNKELQTLDTSDPTEVVEEIGGYFDRAIIESDLDRKKILWCGLASPGLINSHSGEVVRSSNLNWLNVPIRDLTSHRLDGMPVQLEHNVTAAALAEMEYGVGKQCMNFISINLSVGISAGIILDGRVYRGDSGYAGELGHMTLFPVGGPRCACGQYGCFEAVCGVNRVLERIKTEVRSVDVETIGIHDVVAGSLSRNPQVRNILEETGGLIGIAVANLLSLFNPSMIVLSGELSKADVLVNAIVAKAKQMTFDEVSSSVRIVTTEMKKEPQLIGTYVTAMKKVFMLDHWV